MRLTGRAERKVAPGTTLGGLAAPYLIVRIVRMISEWGIMIFSSH